MLFYFLTRQRAPGAAGCRPPPPDDRTARGTWIQIRGTRYTLSVVGLYAHIPTADAGDRIRIHECNVGM